MKLDTLTLNRPINVSVIFAPSKLRRWLLVILVGLASLASYWALEIIRNHHNEGVSTIRTRPDYYVENLNFVKMLPDGQSKYRIVGTKLVHYSFDDHADITLPVITNLDPTQPPMTARAQRGTVKNITNQTDNELHLYDKVVLNRPKTAKAEYLQLNTDYLLVFPDKHTIETDLPVEIISGNTVTTGVGLKGNTVTNQMQVLSHVRSIIRPRPDRKSVLSNVPTSEQKTPNEK